MLVFFHKCCDFFFKYLLIPSFQNILYFFFLFLHFFYHFSFFFLLSIKISVEMSPWCIIRINKIMLSIISLHVMKSNNWESGFTEWWHIYWNSKYRFSCSLSSIKLTNSSIKTRWQEIWYSEHQLDVVSNLQLGKQYATYLGVVLRSYNFPVPQCTMLR